MAYPLVTAFMVLPTASSSSVRSRIDLGMPDMTAIPPALSVMGPKASREMTIPAMESMAMTAMAMP